MLEFIKNLFPLKAKTLDKFIALVGQEKCSSVAVEPLVSPKNTVEGVLGGTIGYFQHFLEFTSKTSRGRKILYRETLFQRFGSEGESVGAEGRGKAAIKSFLIGEERVKHLKSKLPGVTMDLIGPGDKPMDDTLFEKLHEDAAKVGLL